MEPQYHLWARLLLWIWCQRSCSETRPWGRTWWLSSCTSRSMFLFAFSNQHASKSSCGFCGCDAFAVELRRWLEVSWILFAVKIFHNWDHSLERMSKDCRNEAKPFSSLPLAWWRSCTKWWAYQYYCGFTKRSPSWWIAILPFFNGFQMYCQQRCRRSQSLAWSFFWRFLWTYLQHWIATSSFSKGSYTMQDHGQSLWQSCEKTPTGACRTRPRRHSGHQWSTTIRTRFAEHRRSKRSLHRSWGRRHLEATHLVSSPSTLAGEFPSQNCWSRWGLAKMGRWHHWIMAHTPASRCQHLFPFGLTWPFSWLSSTRGSLWHHHHSGQRLAETSRTVDGPLSRWSIGASHLCNG